MASGTGEVPGPGNYKSTGTLATGGYKLGKEQRKGLANENSVPGPGMYSKRDMLDNHGTKFGKDTRKTIEDSKINIGPGQYNFMDNKNQVGSYSFGKGQRSGMGNSVIFIYNVCRMAHQVQDSIKKLIQEILVDGAWVRLKDQQLTVDQEVMM